MNKLPTSIAGMFSANLNLSERWAAQKITRVAPPVSLRLVDHPNDLKPFHATEEMFSKGRLEKDLFEMRVAIQNAHKMLVPLDEYDFNQTFDRATDRTFWEKYTKSMAYPRMQTMFDRFSHLVQLPHDNLLLENGSGTLWLWSDEEKYPGGIVMRTAYTHLIDICVSPFTYVIYPQQRDEFGLVKVAVYSHMYEGGPDKDVLIQEQLGNLRLPENNPVYRYAHLVAIEACEMLLMIRSLNTRIHQYTPTVKELKKLPTVMRNRYDYHVLDIYRAVEGFTSMPDIIGFIGGEKNPIDPRRLAEVKNRFRMVGDEIVFWSPFMKKRHN